MKNLKSRIRKGLAGPDFPCDACGDAIEAGALYVRLLDSREICQACADRMEGSHE